MTQRHKRKQSTSFVSSNCWTRRHVCCLKKKVVKRTENNEARKFVVSWYDTQHLIKHSTVHTVLGGPVTAYVCILHFITNDCVTQHITVSHYCTVRVVWGRSRQSHGWKCSCYLCKFYLLIDKSRNQYFCNFSLILRLMNDLLT